MPINSRLKPLRSESTYNKKETIDMTFLYDLGMVTENHANYSNNENKEE